ncbi:MAG: YitT family protein [Oscillospiraceae bacterium]|nr:YitT family protein [Oscillospiraceae bacterium]
MSLGTLLVAVGVYFFKFPNNFSTGGVSGLSVLLGKALPFPPATISSVINILFLLLGFLVLNRKFGLKTVYCSLLYSALLQGFEWLFPMHAPLTGQKLLELFFAVILPAFGSAILFNLEASTGGTDIAAMILKKFTALDIGKALLISDVVIAASTLFLFDIETGLFCILGLLFKSVLVDSVIESLNRRKSVIVITMKRDEVCDFIIHTLHRSATVWSAVGAYAGTEHHVLLCALSPMQAVALRRYVKSIDSTAFVMASNSSEIFGKGFLRA